MNLDDRKAGIRPMNREFDQTGWIDAQTCHRGILPRNAAWTALALAALIGGPHATNAADLRRDPPDQLFRRAPMSESARSIVIPLGTNLHWAFDAQLLRTHTV